MNLAKSVLVGRNGEMTSVGDVLPDGRTIVGIGVIPVTDSYQFEAIATALDNDGEVTAIYLIELGGYVPLESSDSVSSICKTCPHPKKLDDRIGNMRRYL